jgi:alpha-tubulin suppressor-like RCC1 family protein
VKAILKFSLIPLLLQALTSQAAITVTSISAGFGYSLFLKSDGSLWAMGYNFRGELGDGTSNNTNRPEQIVPAGVTAIAAGGFHSLFIKSDGSLWAMGYNNYGELGDGTFNNTNRPEQIVAAGVTAISAGAYHSLFLKSDGSLWGMGYNYDGELGDGTYSTSAPNGTNRPEQIVANGVTAISAGGSHSLFLRSDGSLWAMGGNQWGQLGDGTFNNTNRPEQIVAGDATAIAAGGTHCLFLKSDGSLWGMGGNGSGQLGDGIFSMLPHYGTNQPEQIVASGAMAISAGGGHSLFLKSDGSLWGTGENDTGTLGDGFIDTNYPAGTAISEQIIPPPQPVLAGGISFQTNLTFSATCLFGGTFHLLAGTNIAQPLNQWTAVWTNVINYRSNKVFRATLTNSVNSSSGRGFYILQSQ